MIRFLRNVRNNKLSVKKAKAFGLFKRFLVVSLACFAFFVLVAGPSQSTSEASDAITGPDLGTTPRFNFLGPDPNGSNSGDKEMLRMANHTKHQDNWTDPVSADVGDEVGFLLYFHNGVPNTVARDSSVKVVLPVGVTNQVVAVSHLWSLDTPDITDTVVPNLGLVGRSGGTIDLSSPGRIELVPGTTQLLTRDPNDLSKLIEHPLPDGITTVGVNIGDIQGCWAYSGFVYFKTKIYPPASLQMIKGVAFPNESTWHKSIDANPGDEVAYRLEITNAGGSVADQVFVTDALSTLTTPINGTTRVWDAPGHYIQAPDNWYAAGLPLPGIAPGGMIYVTYHVRVNQDIAAGSWVLNNVARLFMANTLQRQDEATVFVHVTQPTLQIEKTVFNGTVFAEQANVALNSEAIFQIVVKNSGSGVATNLLIHDIIPAYTIPVPGSATVNGQGSVSGQNYDQIMTAAGLLWPRLEPGATLVIQLRLRPVGCPNNGQVLQNTATIVADGIDEMRNSATIVVSVSLPEEPRIIN